MTKNIVAGRFWPRWSTAWAQAGFVDHSTAIPKRIEDRIALTGRVVAFFTANPGAEVPSMRRTPTEAVRLARLGQVHF